MRDLDVLSLALLGGAAVLFFLGVAIVVANTIAAGLGRAGVAKGLNAIHNVYAAGGQGMSAEERVLAGNAMGRLGRAATSSRSMRWLQRSLDYAGNPPYWTVDRIFEMKGLGLIALGIVGAIPGLLLGGIGGTVAGWLIGAAVGFFLPDAIVYDKGVRRQDEIGRTLPDIIDTLTISVEAGLGFDAALGQVTRFGRGPLAGECARVLQEMQIGRARGDALRAMSARTKVIELKTFCAIVIQATELGIPIANVLREQSREMRIKRRQHAEERAQKVPVKILFPLIFCLFPALFIVVLGPGAISIAKVFLQ